MQRMRLAFLSIFSIQEKQRRGYTNLRAVGYKGYLSPGKGESLCFCLSRWRNTHKSSNIRFPTHNNVPSLTLAQVKHFF